MILSECCRVRAPQRKLGFTLIELLIVIAIVLVLSATLFPVFSRARENARRASCLSNLKQVQMGITMYSQDYDEKLPAYAFASTQTPPLGYAMNGYWLWQQITWDYMKNTQVFYCPSTPITLNEVGMRNGLREANYGANLEAMGKALAEFQAPSETYQIMDWGGYLAWGWDPIFPCSSHQQHGWMPGSGPGSAINKAAPSDKSCSSTTLATTSVRYQDFVSGRHFNGINIGFADGHVKWVKGINVYNQAREWNAGRKSGWSPSKGY